MNVHISHRTWKTSMTTTAAIAIFMMIFSGAAQAKIAAKESGAAPITTQRSAHVPDMTWKPGVLPAADLGAAKNKWLDGAMQSNMDMNCITGNLESITSEFVGYYGNEDVTSPRLGDIYYGRVMVAGVGGPCAGPYANIEVILPPYTMFAIDDTNPVHCSTAKIDEWEFTDLPLEECPQEPYKGRFGWVFNQPDGKPWDVRSGKIIMVAFPMVSTKKMSGIATNSYLTGAVQAIDGQVDPWDDPKQGVFVADNPPTIMYDRPSATGVTTTTAKTTANVLNHYTAGKVYFDIGTSTKYGLTGQVVTLKSDANSYSVYQNWTGLTPGTTYHWRVRFVANGRTYTGADQTFKTKTK